MPSASDVFVLLNDVPLPPIASFTPFHASCALLDASLVETVIETVLLFRIVALFGVGETNVIVGAIPSTEMVTLFVTEPSVAMIVPEPFFVAVNVVNAAGEGEAVPIPLLTDQLGRIAGEMTLLLES